MGKSTEQKPTVLIYGIDREEYKIPTKDIETKTCILHFEPFDTRKEFQHYDGLILFQGIFEKLRMHNGGYNGTYASRYCWMLSSSGISHLTLHTSGEALVIRTHRGS